MFFQRNDNITTGTFLQAKVRLPTNCYKVEKTFYPYAHDVIKMKLHPPGDCLWWCCFSRNMDLGEGYVWSGEMGADWASELCANDLPYGRWHVI